MITILNRRVNLATRLAVISLFTIFALSCSRKQGGDQHQETATNEDEWTGMDEFHMVMAESFHPYKDSADLAPAKKNAAALVDAARKWQTSPLPNKVDNAETKAKLEQLKNDAEAFEQVVTKGDEAEIGQSLTELHKLFHQLQESWYGGQDEQEQH